MLDKSMNIVSVDDSSRDSSIYSEYYNQQKILNFWGINSEKEDNWEQGIKGIR